MPSLSFIRSVLFLILFSVAFFTQANSKSILILGDSLSAGYGITIEEGWVALLEKRLLAQGHDYRVINDSISGDTSSNGLNRIAASLKKYKPAIVLIELGGNDGLRGIHPKTMRRNLGEIVRLAKAANAKVIIVAVPLPPNYGRAYIKRFLSVYQQIAHEQQVPIVDNFLTGIGDNSNLMQADGIHPNAKAQEILLDNVWPIIMQNIVSKAS